MKSRRFLGQVLALAAVVLALFFSLHSYRTSPSPASLNRAALYPRVDPAPQNPGTFSNEVKAWADEVQPIYDQLVRRDNIPCGKPDFNYPFAPFSARHTWYIFEEEKSQEDIDKVDAHWSGVFWDLNIDIAASPNGRKVWAGWAPLGEHPNPSYRCTQIWINTRQGVRTPAEQTPTTFP